MYQGQWIKVKVTEAKSTSVLLVGGLSSIKKQSYYKLKFIFIKLRFIEAIQTLLVAEALLAPTPAVERPV